VLIRHIPVGDPCENCGQPANKHRADHVPVGNPCKRCGLAAARHRIEHKPQGDPCETCGMPAYQHRFRPNRYQDSKQNRIYVGIDGEGQGREEHKYVLLAASVESGKQEWWVHNENGLSTVQCLEFLLNLPQRNMSMFAYAFNYDLTMILRDIPDKVLYELFRPALRNAIKGDVKAKGPQPVIWNGYKLNLQGTKFTAAQGKRHIVIWDVFKFFQSKFVGALKDWKVGNLRMLQKMSHMKDKRSDFDKESIDDVLEYCLSECRCMAELARKLIEAHNKVDLKLTKFYGAGSSAALMLNKMNIKPQLKKQPKEMDAAVASAFFGGRFENSVIGKVTGRVYNYDISSAYPYQLCFLPCLLHGTWEHSTKRNEIESARTALVRYGLRANPRINDWAPFPFRTEGGSICFPTVSGGGWVWKEEFLAGERLCPKNVKFVEAWVYHSDCDCKPFEQIPMYYNERCRIGKEGPGIVLKLGSNSCYGKLAQSIGNPEFNSWIWAGLITSGCRAQLLDVINLHSDRKNLLMVATDGVYTRERFATTAYDARYPLTGKEKTLANPRDTGTALTGKPLGGWEEKVIEQGVFVARPGIYFPLNPTVEQLKDIRGRGVGKGVVLENWQRIIASWQRYGLSQSADIANVSRFCGAKSSIHRSGKEGAYIYTRANGKCVHGFRNAKGCDRGCIEHDIPSYGQWITRSVNMSFDPLPKREGVNRDGITLKLRQLDTVTMSMPYSKAVKSQEAEMIKQAYLEVMEQPDVDLSTYELDDDNSA
jgi:hypothetical protein